MVFPKAIDPSRQCQMNALDFRKWQYYRYSIFQEWLYQHKFWWFFKSHTFIPKVPHLSVSSFKKPQQYISGSATSTSQNISTEAEFLDKIQTKVFRVSSCYSQSLLQLCLEISFSSNSHHLLRISSNSHQPLICISTVQLLYTAKVKRRKAW